MHQKMGNCFKRTMLSIPAKNIQYSAGRSEVNNTIDQKIAQPIDMTTYSPFFKSRLYTTEKQTLQTQISSKQINDQNSVIANPISQKCHGSKTQKNHCNNSSLTKVQPEPENVILNETSIQGNVSNRKINFILQPLIPIQNSPDIKMHVLDSNNKLDNTPIFIQNSLKKQSNVLSVFTRSCHANCYIALFNYSARTDEETSFQRRDEVLLLSNTDPDWWFVQHVETGHKGYAPSLFFARKGTIEAEEWFMPKLSRKDSERLLLSESNSRGVFLIRESETSQGALTLSVRDEQYNVSVSMGNTGGNEFTNTVKHYRIKYPDRGFYCITTYCSFSSLQDLVKFYSSDSYGLCCKLTRASQRPAPIISDLSIKTKDQWEIPKSSIVLTEKLGAGQFGEVWRGTWNGTTEVAVKTLKQGTMTKAEFLEEACIMRAARHPKLVRLYAVCTEDPIYIVTELMCNGSLLDYLRDGPGKDLLLNSLVDMMAQIASGMAYLEKEHYIHRDLAARNILVGENNCVKVADFGLTRMVEDRYSIYMAQKSTKFPIKWTAPEAALSNRFTIKSDIWSFGIVIYELITYGQVPYPSMNNTETLRQVSNGYRMPKSNNCPQPIYDILLQMWDSIPDKRPTFMFLFEFFDNYFISSADTNYKNGTDHHAHD